MFSLFKRKPAPTALAEVTFKTRVARFWEWYASVAARIYQTIEDGKAAELVTEMSVKVHEIAPGFAWVFGPGDNDEGHSFTLSGEGEIHRQLLTAYWLARAPKLTGWTFYSARQASSDPSKFSLKTDGHKFDAAALWLTPSVNVEDERIDLTVWHPLFPKLDDRARWRVVFLLLDEALGEISTQNWIGKIEMNDQKLTGAIPLGELRAHVERQQAEYGWKKGGPGELWTLYEPKEEKHDQPRGDVYVGTTSAMTLIRQFLKAKGQLEDPLAGTGAEYVYIAFDASVLPKGKEIDARGEMEDAFSTGLGSAASGLHIGGAMGRRSVYIDLLLFDGAGSIALVLDTLRRLRLPAGTSINYFAHEKRGHRLVL